MYLFYKPVPHFILLVLLLFVGLQSASAQDKLYWTDAGTSDAIVRSDLDGSNVEVIVSTGLVNPAGIAVDPINGKIYWTDTQDDSIKRANLDGSDIEPVVTTGLVTPAGIVLDLLANKMYWVDQGNDTIKRANLDGSSVETILDTGLDAPIDLILDYGPGNVAGLGMMYWTDQGDDTIKRALTDGSSVTTIVSQLNNPFEIELDLQAGKIYWTETAGNVVRRSNLDGSSMETLVDVNDDISTPAALAINQGSANPNLGGGDLYFSTRTSPDAIFQANLDGTGLNPIVSTNVDFVNFLDIGPAVVLPVELMSFDALVESDVVNLIWETASETDNAGFELQMRSFAAWETLAFIDGAGTTAEPQSYTYRVADLTPGTYSFRLKQVDFDGSFEHSPIVQATVELPGTHALSAAYPNPFSTQATFSLAVAREQQVKVELFDMIGRKVADVHQGLLAANTAHTLQVEARDLPGGLYVFRVQGESFEATRMVMLAR